MLTSRRNFLMGATALVVAGPSAAKALPATLPQTFPGEVLPLFGTTPAMAALPSLKLINAFYLEKYFPGDMAKVEFGVGVGDKRMAPFRKPIVGPR